MKINSRQNPQDSLYHDAKNMLGIITTASETTTLPLAEFFRSANEWGRQINTWVMQIQGSWKYDDNNLTDFPIAVSTLVDQQQDYALPSTILKLERVEILDVNGNYQELQPVSREWVKQTAMTEFYKTPGMPLFYYLLANSILLYPAPATGYVTMSSGIKIYFNRTVNAFAITDTSTKPGIVENFHRIISAGAALDFANSRNMQNTIPILINKLNSLKSDLQEFYSSRQPNVKTEFRITRESTI